MPAELSFALCVAQFVVGLFAENAGEWVFHRYVLHGLGKRPGSIWNYHWHEHHRVSQINGMLDLGYRGAVGLSAGIRKAKMCCFCWQL
jgi:hypothetical protein